MLLHVAFLQVIDCYREAERQQLTDMVVPLVGHSPRLFRSKPSANRRILRNEPFLPSSEVPLPQDYLLISLHRGNASCRLFFALDVSPAQDAHYWMFSLGSSLVQVHMPKHSWLPVSFPKDLSQKRKGCASTAFSKAAKKGKRKPTTALTFINRFCFTPQEHTSLHGCLLCWLSKTCHRKQKYLPVWLYCKTYSLFLCIHQMSASLYLSGRQLAQNTEHD